MPKVEEKYKTRQFNDRSGKVTYFVTDLTNYDSPGEAITAVESFLLLDDGANGTGGVGSLDWGNPTLAYRDTSCDLVAPRMYEATATWGEFEGVAPPAPKVGTLTYGFNLTTTTAKVTTSLETVRETTGAKDWGGLIGVNQDGQPEGADILVPNTEFNYTFTAENSVLTDSYIRGVERLVGKISNAPFFGRAVGEVMFLGASGRQSYGGRVNSDITFNFAYSENRTAANGNPIQIPGLSAIDKLGWELLWVYFEQIKNPDNSTTLKPASAYVERVYEYGNFTDLGPWVVLT